MYAVSGADRAIVVTTAEISAIRDADRIIGLLESAEIKNPELIVNRLRPSMVKKGEMMDVDDIVDLLPLLPLLPAVMLRLLFQFFHFFIFIYLV